MCVAGDWKEKSEQGWNVVILFPINSSFSFFYLQVSVWCVQLSEDLQIDYESYTWRKLDANSDEAKKLVEEYLCWEGDFGGKKFNQGKIFKWNVLWHSPDITQVFDSVNTG